MDVQMAVIDVDVRPEDSRHEWQAAGVVDELEECFVEPREGKSVKGAGRSRLRFPNPIDGRLQPL